MGSLGGCSKLIKYIMFGFNIILWIIGLVLLAFSIWAFVDKDFVKFWKARVEDVKDTDDKKQIEEITKFLQGCAIAGIVCGSFIMILGFLGCCGAIKESRIMLGIYAVILFLILAALVSITIWVFVSDSAWNTMEDTLKKIMEKDVKTIIDAKGDTKGAVLLPIFQMNQWLNNIKCCGATNGVADYKSLDKSKLNDICTQTTPDTKPCPKAIIEEMKELGDTGAIISACCAGGLLLIVLAAVCLCCAIDDDD